MVLSRISLLLKLFVSLAPQLGLSGLLIKLLIKMSPDPDVQFMMCTSAECEAVQIVLLRCPVD